MVRHHHSFFFCGLFTSASPSAVQPWLRRLSISAGATLAPRGKRIVHVTRQVCVCDGIRLERCFEFSRLIFPTPIQQHDPRGQDDSNMSFHSHWEATALFGNVESSPIAVAWNALDDEVADGSPRYNERVAAVVAARERLTEMWNALSFLGRRECFAAIRHHEALATPEDCCTGIIDDVTLDILEQLILLDDDDASSQFNSCVQCVIEHCSDETVSVVMSILKGWRMDITEPPSGSESVWQQALREHVADTSKSFAKWPADNHALRGHTRASIMWLIKMVATWLDQSPARTVVPLTPTVEEVATMAVIARVDPVSVEAYELALLTVEMAELWMQGANGAAAARPYVLLLSDTRTGATLQIEMEDLFERRPTPSQVFSRLLQKMGCTPSVRIRKLVCEDRKFSDLFADALYDGLGIRVATSMRELPSVVRIRGEHMVHQFSLCDAMFATDNYRNSDFLWRATPLLKIPGMTVTMLRALYAASATFHKAAPWTVCNTKLVVLVPGFPERLACVMGNLGQTTGIAIEELHSDSHTGYTPPPGIVFLPLGEVPVADAFVAATHKFEVYNDLHPTPFFGKGGAHLLNQRPVLRDLEWLVAALPAVTEFCQTFPTELTALARHKILGSSDLILSAAQSTVELRSTIGGVVVSSPRVTAVAYEELIC